VLVSKKLKNPRWRHLEFFEKLFSAKFASYKHEEIAKKDLKNVESYLKNLILVRHFGSNHYFELISQNMLIKQNAKRIGKCQNIMPLRISVAIFDIRRHLESEKQLLLYETCPTKIQAQIKNRMQKCSKLTELWSKNQFFSHFKNHCHFENHCHFGNFEKNFTLFEVLIIIESVTQEI
jgi:hypothetical protein